MPFHRRARSLYLNLWWPNLLMHIIYAMFGLNELIYFSHFCHCLQDDNNDDTVADEVGIDVSAQTCSIMTSLHGNAFHITDPFCDEPSGHWWIPCTKASDEALWCFLWWKDFWMYRYHIRTRIVIHNCEWVLFRKYIMWLTCKSACM